MKKWLIYILIFLNLTFAQTLNFDLNGGTNNDVNLGNFSSGQISLKDPIKEGYVFKGWTLQKYPNFSKNAKDEQGANSVDITNLNYTNNKITFTLPASSNNTTWGGGVWSGVADKELSIPYGTCSSYKMTINSTVDIKILFDDNTFVASGNAWNTEDNSQVSEEYITINGTKYSSVYQNIKAGTNEIAWTLCNKSAKNINKVALYDMSALMFKSSQTANITITNLRFENDNNINKTNFDTNEQDLSRIIFRANWAEEYAIYSAKLLYNSNNLVQSSDFINQNQNYSLIQKNICWKTLNSPSKTIGIGKDWTFVKKSDDTSSCDIILS